MKKITNFAIAFIMLTYISSCTGYKPIFSSSNISFEISEYSIKDDKKIGNQIYSKLYRLFRINKNNSDSKKINILIESSKKQEPTVKNNAGKILEYKIILKSSIVLTDFLTGNTILNYNTSLSSSYEVQDLFSETKKAENKIIGDLIDRTYQDLLIKITEISSQNDN